MSNFNVSALQMQRFSQSDGDFEARVCALKAPMEALDPNLVSSVRDIISEVRSRGDQALLEFTQRFDQHPAESVSELVFEGDALKAFESQITGAERAAITEAAQRIRRY
ncbi:MAG: histidinol dehydrogenase, partial [Pseudomonadota bacterium]|nr:histidinol dehydrogenase [Pseudomonadota bacterium]